MKHLLIALVMCIAMGATAETPQEGAKAILELLKARDYDTLFQQRYAEWYKVEEAGKEPAEAIKLFSARWEKQYDMIVTVYEQLTEADFEEITNEHAQPSETGDMAVATVTIADKEIPYRLYKMKTGLWGFHM